MEISKLKKEINDELTTMETMCGDVDVAVLSITDKGDRLDITYKTPDAQVATSTIPCDGISNAVESNPPPKPVAFFDHRNEPDCTTEYQVYDKQEADAYIHWLEQKAGVL